MKIRYGFVSNSSTSSFLLYGVCIETSKIFDALTDDAKSALNIDDGEYSNTRWDIDEIESVIPELIDSESKEMSENLAVRFVNDWDELFVGIAPQYMRLDETRRQFQYRVEDMIRKVFKTPDDGFDYHDHVYYC